MNGSFTGSATESCQSPNYPKAEIQFSTHHIASRPQPLFQREGRKFFARTWRFNGDDHVSWRNIPNGYKAEFRA
jgi:hypothetical protein